MRIVYFDTETTGLDAQQCQIIELAAQAYEGSKKVGEMDDLIRLTDPEATLPEKIVELTHITDELLAKEGIAVEEAAKHFAELCGSGPVILVAHNAQFDLGFITWTFARHYRQGLEVISRADYLDTLTIAKDRKAYPHTLAAMIEYYGLNAQNSHRAIDDVDALVKLFQAMIKERDDIREYINVFGYNPKYGISGRELKKVRYISQPYIDQMATAEDILPRRK